MDPQTYVIGVTGGIGSGKSSVSAIMAELGAEVVDADEISHGVTQGGMPAVYEIADAFGDRFVDMYGRLRRQALAKHVFSDPERVRRLESIIHRYVIMDIESRVKRFRQRGRGVMALDVPIPVEHGFRDQCDLIWVVDAEEDIRIARVMQRSDMTEEEVRERMASQMSRGEYMAIADRIITNNGTREELYTQVCRAAESIAEDIAAKTDSNALGAETPGAEDNKEETKEKTDEESGN